MKKNRKQLQIGDVVVVEVGVHDPDLGIPIGGWQGTISDIDKSNNTVCIDWDSQTLRSIPASVITKCEVDGLDWRQMYLVVTEVEPATSRDTAEQLQATMDQLEASHSWDHLGEEGELIKKVLNSATDDESELDEFELWKAHLSRTLVFPFNAKISDFQERGPLRFGAEVCVQSLIGVDDLRGVIAELVKSDHPSKQTNSARSTAGWFGRLSAWISGSDRQVYKFPLCDLDAIDRKSRNHKELHLYSVWYSNR